jgi:hypothetical protein
MAGGSPVAVPRPLHGTGMSSALGAGLLYGGPATAYVRQAADGGSLALLNAGTTTVLVEGRFASAEAENILSNLRER